MNKRQTEYERGWQAAMEYLDDRRTMARVEHNATSLVTLLPFGMVAVLFGAAWLTALISFGQWHGEMLLVSIGVTVIMGYIVRGARRDRVAVEAKRAELDRKWAV